jgi:uncharacterized membrane protein YbaN (DUF454 family)
MALSGHNNGRAEEKPHATGPWVRCCERHGVIEMHDARLFQPARAAFCRALAETAVARFGARRADVLMDSSTCRLEFEPGRFDRAELADRAASAVRAATPSVRCGAGGWDNAAGILRASAIDGATSPGATRGATSDVATFAGHSIPASAGSRRLTDLAKAAASLTLAVSGAILPGIPTVPFLILTGRYAVRVFPRIERLMLGQSWCAAFLTEVEIPSGPTLDRRSLARMIGLALLVTAGSLILHPPLPIVLGLELGLMTSSPDPRGDNSAQSSRGKNRSTVRPRRPLRKRTSAHVVGILLRGTKDRCAELRVLFHKRRHERIKEAEHVITNQHLTVAVRSRPDADRGNLQPGCDCPGDGIWNRFEYDCKGSGVFKGQRIEYQLAGGGVIARLLAHAPESMPARSSNPAIVAS